MCTVMAFRETLPAEQATLAETQRAVDWLMKYERKLADEPRRGESEQPEIPFLGEKKECKRGIDVWLIQARCGWFRKRNFYYVRERNPLRYCSTAYEPPMLIVQKSKLRLDQIEYMERKCRESLDNEKKMEIVE